MFSIAKARIECQRRLERMDKKGQNIPLSSYKPVDVLAIVQQIHSFENCCSIDIQDASGTASVLIFGAHKRKRVQEEWQTGDVVRFNRLALQNNNKSFQQQQPLSTFVHSLLDPEAGLEYFRLARIGNGQVVFNSAPTPPSMETNPASLTQLAAWYLGRRSNNTGGAQQQPLETLAPLPCHLRTISDLQSCLGTPSHLIGWVSQLETRQPSLQKHKKRKRPKSSLLQGTTITYATVTDPSKSCLTLRLETRRFDGVLQNAFQNKLPIRMSTVVSKAAGSQEVLLHLTNESDISIVENVPSFEAGNTHPTQQTQLSLLVDKADGTHSTTGQTTTRRRILHYDSPLLDVVIGNVPLRQYSDIHEACRQGNRYASSVVQLEGMALDCNNGSVLKRLCGGLGIDEWSDPPQRNIVTRMMVGLLEEAVLLKWKLIWTDTAGYRVEDVWIPKL